MIWPHSESDLHNFIMHMNSANSSIKFTYKHSQQEVVFLDVVVHNKPGHREGEDILQTRIHIKPTNKQLYVRHNSYHPPGTGKGVIIGEAVRYLCTNSDPKQFANMIHKHKKNLAKRGYGMSQTAKQLSKIKFSMRTHRALKQHSKRNDETPPEAKKPTFVTRYCPNAQRAFRIVLKHWTSAYDSTDIPLLRRFLRCTPRMAYRANPNLANRLVRAKLKPIHTGDDPDNNNNSSDNTTQQQMDTNVNVDIICTANLRHSHVSTSMQPPVGGSDNNNSVMTHCRNTKCPLHTRLIDSRQVRSKISRRTYMAQGKATCDTPYIVYLLTTTTVQYNATMATIILTQ